MAIRSENDIITPGLGDPGEYTSQMAAMAVSIDQALDKRANARVGTSAQRTASIGDVPEGTLWMDTNGAKALYTKQGNSWERIWPIDVSPTARSFLRSQSGWTSQPGKNHYIKRRGEWVVISWFLKRTGGTINVPSSGDIVNQTVAILNEEWRPHSYQALTCGESGRVASFGLSNKGEIRLNAVGGTANINKNSVFQVRGWYNINL